jgi:hypothetical protein
MKKTIKQIKESRAHAIKRHFIRGLVTGILASIIVICTSGNYPTTIETSIFTLAFACIVGVWNGFFLALYKTYTLWQ